MEEEEISKYTIRHGRDSKGEKCGRRFRKKGNKRQIGRKSMKWKAET
jgi:hypothetical protein